MGQGNSKVGREENSLKIEDEKKFQDEIQKHKEKKEQKRKQSNQRTREHRTHEMKLCHADQESTNTNTIHENMYPTSTCSTELEHEFWSNDKDKADNDSNEHVHKFPASFEGNDNGDCVNVHNYLFNQTVHVASAIVEPVFKSITGQEKHAIFPNEKQNQHSTKENVNSVLAKKDMTIKDKLNQENVLAKTCPMPSSDTIVKKIDQDDLELEVRKGDGLNNCKNETCLTKQASSTAEKMRKKAKNDEMHAGKKAAQLVLIINDRLRSVKEDSLHELYNKSFCEDTLSLDDLNLPYENVLCKFSVDNVDHLRVRAFWYPINRPLYEHIYAIGFRSEPILLQSFGDQSIKYILQRPHLRDLYLEDEHFRLATFSLSASNYKMGDMLKLSAWGYFFDVDRRVKCFSCKNTYRSGNYEDHGQNCIGRYSDRNAGRSIADYYGEFAAERLVPSGQNVQEEHRFSGSIDIHIRQTTTSFRLGGTQQFAQYDTETQDHEVDDNEEEISVRDGLTSSRTVSPQGENLDVYSSENRRRDTEWEHTALPSSNLILTQRQEDPLNVNHGRDYFPHESDACYRSAGRPDTCSADLPQDQRLSNNEAEQSNDGWRTIKEDVNRGRPKPSAERCILLMENERLRSRTRCRICNNRRCNIVFKPCGHLVICDNCITNTTECPVCKKKVDEAYHCG